LLGFRVDGHLASLRREQILTMVGHDDSTIISTKVLSSLSSSYYTNSSRIILSIFTNLASLVPKFSDMTLL